ncbi:MAG: radical SAM protein [Myxococcota bacterium]
MAPLLRAAPQTPRPGGGTANQRLLLDSLTLDPSRELIVGVLPHTQCAPTVEGCGFCTFPHDRHDKRGLRHVAHAVGREISAAPEELRARSVVAVYLGGATANLTPPAQLREVLSALGSTFSLAGAEVTLEGVPSLFLAWWGGPLEVLRDGPGGTRRVSMGVQTFDREWLARMGRLGFGDRRVVEQVVARAHGYGMTTSGDFLLGLPGRPAADELQDLRVAVELGLDQICAYPLVLAGDTPWALDPAMRASMPAVEEGRHRWRAACAQLVAAGYTQTTLTNFERGAARFRYEVASYAVDRTDAVGFGPLAISTFVDPAARRAVKTQRARAVDPSPVDPIGLWFPYEAEDLSLLFVTRSLAALRVDRARYRALLGADLLEHHGPVVRAVVDAGLATLDDAALALTTDGTWFADAVAGTFAEARAAEVRIGAAGQHTADQSSGRVLTLHMG